NILFVPFDGALWTLVSAMQNVVAVIVLIAIAWAFERRLISKPRRLTYNRDALIILGMIGGVLAPARLSPGCDVARFGPVPGAFVANALGGALSGAAPATLEAIFAVLWWAHIVLVAAFLIYLPFSKHLHIATSFFNIWYRKLAPRGELPAMDLER